MLILAIAVFLLCAPAFAGGGCWGCKRGSAKNPIEDGRRFCSRCLKHNVFTEEQAEPLSWDVETYLNGLFGTARYKVSPKLLDEPSFRKMVRANRVQGNVQGFFSFRNRTVYIVTGLTPVAYRGLLAHESVHAWQHQYCRGQDRDLTEGLATLVQYKYLVKSGFRSHAKSLTKISFYGPLLKKLLVKEKKVGLYALIEKARQSKKFSELLSL